MAASFTRTRTETEDETQRRDLTAEIARDPAFSQIARYLTTASELGFDPRDPEILLRAMTAGRRAHAEDEQRRNRTSLAGADWSKRHLDVVYYARQGNLIKIGTTKNLANRMSDLGAQGVLVVEMGGSDVETARHRQFAAHRSHRREWFHAAPALIEHIFALREALEAELGESVDEWMNRIIFRRPAVPYQPRAHNRSPMTASEKRVASERGLIGLGDAAQLADVPTARIAQWCARGTLVAAEVSDSGMRLFRPADVLAAATSIEASKED
jgi:hypothetical protein